MAFKIAPKNQVTLKAVVRELTDGEKIQESELNVTFNRMNVADFDDYSQQIIDVVKATNARLRNSGGDIDAEDEKLNATINDIQRAALVETVVDVSPLVDEDGKTLDFSDEVLDWLLDYQPTFKALVDAFSRLHNGEAEADRVKNSKKRARTGH